MRNSSHYESGVVQVGPEDNVGTIVSEMIHYAVGCVVVVDEQTRPLGIVTDRDLLRRVVCTERDPRTTHARDVMTAEPVTGRTDEPLERILEKMKSLGVRRLPIVHDEKVVGLVSLDDIVAEIGRELADIRAALRSEVLGSRRDAQRRRRRDEVVATMEELRGQIAGISAESREWIQRELEALRKRLHR